MIVARKGKNTRLSETNPGGIGWYREGDGNVASRRGVDERGKCEMDREQGWIDGGTSGRTGATICSLAFNIEIGQSYASVTKY